MKLFSLAFRDGDLIPPKYTCDGEDVSPPLEWEDVPSGTKTFTLIVDDPDAPSGVFVHWLLFDIPATQKGVTEGIGSAAPKAGGGIQATNGFKNLAYGGPCPPQGTHRYYFRLYALHTRWACRQAQLGRTLNPRCTATPSRKHNS